MIKEKTCTKSTAQTTASKNTKSLTKERSQRSSICPPKTIKDRLKDLTPKKPTPNKTQKFSLKKICINKVNNEKPKNTSTPHPG